MLDGAARFRPPLLAEMAKALAVREFEVRRVLALKVREGELADIGDGRYLLRSTLAEIAAILDCSPDSAKSRLFRARKAFSKKAPNQMLKGGSSNGQH